MRPNEITFCPLKLDLNPDEIALMLSEIRQVPEHFWFQNKFRNCSMLSMLNYGGFTSRTAITQAPKGEFLWTEPAGLCPQTQRLVTGRVFSWMERLSRVTVLRGEPGLTLHTHIDCADTEVGTLQHKFRIVLDGQVSDLYFVGPNGQSLIPVSCDNPVYILDGGHPHGMRNSTDRVRYTLCIASPWRGENSRYQEILRANIGQAISISRPPIEKKWCDIERLGYGQR